MEEVIALENQIRKTLAAEAQARELTTSDQMVLDALAIMAGKPTSVTGTRLDRLRIIAAGLDQRPSLSQQGSRRCTAVISRT